MSDLFGVGGLGHRPLAAIPQAQTRAQTRIFKQASRDSAARWADRRRPVNLHENAESRMNILLKLSCVYLCVSMSAYLRDMTLHIHMWVHVMYNERGMPGLLRVHGCMHVYVDTWVRASKNARHECSHKCMHACRQAFIYSYIAGCMPAFMQADETNAGTWFCIYMHGYRCAYMQLYKQKLYWHLRLSM